MNKNEDIKTEETESQTEARKPAGSFLKELIQQVLIALVLFFVLINFVLIPCEVDGTSMYPTLQEGDFGYSFIITRSIAINRFDIVVIKVKSDDEEEKLLVKRVVGMPGEKIAYISNKLYVNDVYVEEPFLNDDVVTGDLEKVLSDDEYFCLGDNRSVSRDSRYYGGFDKKQIVSSHIFVVNPFKDLGFKK